MANPQLTAIEPQSAHMIKVTFNVPVGDSALNPDNYQLSGTGQGSLPDYPDFVERIDDTNYNLIWISAGIDKVIEYGSSVQLDAIVGGTGPYKYSWSPTEGLDDPTIINPIATPTQTTEYTLTVTKEGEEIDSGAITDSITIKTCRSSITQYEITWTFDRSYECGQFITGDWWVVGPVKVMSVSPAATGSGLTYRNGSEINPVGSEKEGFDGRKWSSSTVYDSRKSVVFPVTLAPDQSLVSSVGRADTDANDPDPYKSLDVIGNKGALQRVNLRAAAVLTCLSSPPSGPAFRPPYAGSSKPLIYESELQKEILDAIALSPATGTFSQGLVDPYTNVTYTPGQQYTRIFSRPWILTLTGGSSEAASPMHNQPAYYRETHSLESEAALLLLCDKNSSVFGGDKGSRDDLLVAFVQYGIDTYYTLLTYSTTVRNHRGMSKWPAIFAGVILGREEMTSLPIHGYFKTDAMTYYGTEWTNPGHGKISGYSGELTPSENPMYALNTEVPLVSDLDPDSPRIYEHIDPFTVGWCTIYAGSPPKEDHQWNAEVYRRQSNSWTWIGTALAARIMGMIATWNHDAFFDYVDRWMYQSDSGWFAELKAIAGHDPCLYDPPRNYLMLYQQGKVAYGTWVNKMWAAYR